jgi:hypothetical protein
MTARTREDRYAAWRMAVEAMHEVGREGFTAVFPTEPPEHVAALMAGLGVRVWISPLIGTRPMVLTPAEFDRFCRHLAEL